MTDERERRPPDPEELLGHAQWVRGLALSLAQDASLAEDAVQDTWLAALRKPPRSSRGVRSWLAEVVRNSLRQRRRGETTRAQREHAHARDEALPSTDELVEAVDTQRTVVEELLRLRDPERKTILLRYFRDLSSAEIARREGLPPATVRSHLKRGLDALRSRLDELHDGDRRAWAGVLVGLAGPETVPAAPPPDFVTGVLAMGTAAKLSLVLGIALVAGVTWTVLDPSEAPTPKRTFAAGVEEEPVMAAPPVLAEPDAGAAAARVVGAERATIEPEPAAVEEVEEEPAEVVWEDSAIEVRLTDADGNSLQGARLYATFHGSSGRWGESEPAVARFDGVAHLAQPMRHEHDTRVLVFEADGYERRVANAAVQSGTTTHMGTIVLARATSLAGHVLDERGSPVSGARVWVLASGVQDDAKGQVLRRGPQHGIGDLEIDPLQATTDELGRYLLTNIPVGEQRVWAHKEDFRYSWSDAVPVQLDVPVQDVDLVLTPLQPEDMIGGRVLKPNGNPLTNFYVKFHFTDSDMGMTSGFMTDAEGRFSHVLHRAVPHDLTVSGEPGQWGEEQAPGIQPGDHDVLIQLREPRTIELLVTDPDGKPIEFFSVSVRIFHGNTKTISRDYAGNEEREGGLLTLNVPAGSFELRVSCPGYTERVLGPFLPETVEELLECRLDRHAAIRGRVFAGDTPVPDATVDLYVAVTGDMRRRVNGFPCRMVPSSSATTRTDRDGRFVLGIEESGEYFFRADADGRTATELGPVFLQVGVEADGFELELVEGGVLEVRVRPPVGRDVAGIVVGITNGGPHPATARTDADGIARFEGLTPGRYEVDERDEEILPFSRTSSAWHDPTEAAFEMPWKCEVVGGRVTGYTLVLGE